MIRQKWFEVYAIARAKFPQFSSGDNFVFQEAKRLMENEGHTVKVDFGKVWIDNVCID